MEVALQKTVKTHKEVQKVVEAKAAARQRFPQCERDEEDRDLQDRKQEIQLYGKARNLRLEHSTERSRSRGPRTSASTRP